MALGPTKQIGQASILMFFMFFSGDVACFLGWHALPPYPHLVYPASLAGAFI